MGRDAILAGRVALVTGGGRGIGPALCEGLASAGSTVAVNYRQSRAGAEAVCRGITELGGVARAVEGDVSSVSSIWSMFERVEEQLGPVDILVNNAGIFPYATWDSITEAGWDEVFDTNVKGMFFCSQRAATGMARRGWGRILNIGSVSYFLGRGGLPYSHYIASKGAAVGLTRALAHELGSSGITVNAIAPGAIVTAGEVALYPDAQALAERQAERQAVPRRIVPEDVAAAVVFFASPEASAVTGQTLLVDGGWAMS